MDDEKRARRAPWLCALVSGILGPACASCAVLFRFLHSPVFLMVIVFFLPLILAAYMWKDRVTEGYEISLPAQIFSFFFPILASVPAAMFYMLLFAMGVLG